MKLHTARTLFDKWNEIHRRKRELIKQLKEKRKNCTDEAKLSCIQGELEELFIEVNLIHQLLADVGVMVYVEENKSS